LKPRHRTAFC